MNKKHSYFSADLYRGLFKICIFSFAVNVSYLANAGQQKSMATATYLGNEAVMVAQDDAKILFDPFFQNGYNSYQLVPEEFRTAMLSGQSPFDGINAIFISHAHGDHFSAEDLLTYFARFPDTRLIAPKQAVQQILELPGGVEIKNSIQAIDLQYQDAPVSDEFGSIHYDVVRIPHAGWPGRAEISNLVFRVTLNEAVTVVHMGDADTDGVHYDSLTEHWDRQKSDIAFPPYWFFNSKSGQVVLTQRLKATKNIGVHVPIEVPEELIESGEKYFSRPGEILQIGESKPSPQRKK